MSNRYDKKAFGESLEVLKGELKYPFIKAPANIDSIIDTISSGSFNSKDPLEVLEYCVSLEYYSLFLSQEINKIEARIKWYESNLCHIVGVEMKNSIGFTFPEKNADIRANVTLASELEEQKLTEVYKLENMKFIAQKITSLAKVLESYARSKSYVERSGSSL